ncbi:MAG TPA: (Fe-S)-binding protein [Coriobacteriaceae bacterium]|nr:(Fe-S)-binding protein [Coriobacteriaceae bacterium]
MHHPLEDVQDFSDSCIRCGLCARTDCGNFSNGEPCLGELCESLLNGEDTWDYVPFTCALCNRCTISCPVDLRASRANKPLRALLLKQKPELKPLYRKFRTDLKHNVFSSLRARDSGDINDVIYIQGEADLGGVADHTAFFPGCALYAYAPELTAKVSQWLRDEQIAAYTLTICCGATFYDVGFYDEFDAYRERVQAFLREREIEHLVVTCPHCAHILPQLVEGMGIDLVRLPDLLVERGMISESDETITFHDACYDRSAGVFGNAARALFDKADIKPMPHEKRDSLCCGGGGMVSVYAPDYCVYRRNQRLAEIDGVEVDRVLSTCFSCVNSLQRGIGSTPVQHYLEQIFDCPVDWGKVYASVDALFADPEYERLCESDELTIVD